jgi:hypothetical protein
MRERYPINPETRFIGEFEGRVMKKVRLENRINVEKG